MAAYVKKAEMTQDEWLTDRMNYLGASETAAVLGLDRYRSPLDVYLEKRGEKESEPAGVRAEAGLRAEQMIADWIGDLYNLKIQKDNKIRIHPALPFWRCNLDRVIVGQPNGTAVLEIKTTSLENLKRWDLHSDNLNPIFVHHWIQVQAQLAITGYRWAALGVMPADSYQGFGQPEFIPIQPDQEFIRMMTEKVRAFWLDHIEKGVPPDPINLSDLQVLYPRSEPKTLVVDETTLKLVTRVARFRKAKKNIEEKLEQQELSLKMLLENYEVAAYSDEIICTYKSAKDKETFNTEKFLQSHPDEAKRCMKSMLDSEAVKAQYPDLYKACLDTKPGARSLLMKFKL